MTVRTFRKRPVTVRAVQWTGDNQAEAEAFLGTDFAGYKADPGTDTFLLLIRTLENPDNPFEAPVGWWVLQGVAGEHYACRADILERTYESAGPMPVADGVCTCGRCESSGRCEIYRMVGSCYNCKTEPVLMLFRSGDKATRLDCPRCGVFKSVHPSRLAADDEIPAVVEAAAP